VNPASAEPQSEHGGQTYYFCSMECKERYDQHPLQYLDESDRVHARLHRENPAA
jgi:Cu+-exporting ATPase